jgi:hypothetical protein
MDTLTKRTRPRGFAEWNPRPDTMALIHLITAILAEYADYVPLTCRQIFYRLVGTKGFPKTENDYSRLCEVIGRSRRAGMIPFDHIRDDGTARREFQTWSGANAFLDDIKDRAEGFRLDRQAGQELRLLVMCEAGGMAPMLAQVANPYGIAVLTSGGFDSLTAKHDLALELAGVIRDGVWPEVLHIGDLDPSGVHLFSSLAEDVSAMVQALSGVTPIFSRLAVTQDQVDRLGLVTAPPKPTDNRRFTGQTVQAEAIAPDVLSDLLRDAIEARRDQWATDAVLIREKAIRADLVTKLEGLS